MISLELINHISRNGNICLVDGKVCIHLTEMNDIIFEEINLWMMKMSDSIYSGKPIPPVSEYKEDFLYVKHGTCYKIYGALPRDWCWENRTSSLQIDYYEKEKIKGVRHFINEVIE